MPCKANIAFIDKLVCADFRLIKLIQINWDCSGFTLDGYVNRPDFIRWRCQRQPLYYVNELEMCGGLVLICHCVVSQSYGNLAINMSVVYRIVQTYGNLAKKNVCVLSGRLIIWKDRYGDRTLDTFSAIEGLLAITLKPVFGQKKKLCFTLPLST